MFKINQCPGTDKVICFLSFRFKLACAWVYARVPN